MFTCSCVYICSLWHSSREGLKWPTISSSQPTIWTISCSLSRPMALKITTTGRSYEQMEILCLSSQQTAMCFIFILLEIIKYLRYYAHSDWLATVFISQNIETRALLYPLNIGMYILLENIAIYLLYKWVYREYLMAHYLCESIVFQIEFSAFCDDVCLRLPFCSWAIKKTDSHWDHPMAYRRSTMPFIYELYIGKSQ